MEEFEFRVVGKDQDGNPLYQKVKLSEKSVEQDQPTVEEQTFNVPEQQKQQEKTVEKRVKNTNHQSFNAEKDNKPTLKQANKNIVTSCPNDFLYVNMSPDLVEIKHQDSKKKFPVIAFRDKEFIVKIVNRHPLGLVLIWGLAGIISLILMVFWSIVFFSSGSVISDTVSNSVNLPFLSTILFFSLILMSMVFAYIVSSIYSANKFVVTTERVVQYMSNGLFDKKKQTIDLGWIEDVSYHKTGIFASIFNFGSVRLSTIGDESTYYLKTVKSPEIVSSQLNELVLAVKNQDPMPNIYD